MKQTDYVARLKERGRQHPCNGLTVYFGGKDHFRRYKGSLRGAWAAGYAAAFVGPEECPYETYSHHGGTWGYQMSRAWQLGNQQGRAEGGDSR